MRIVGSHDEILFLKMECQKKSQCKYCVMETFCKIEGTEIHNPLGLFTAVPFKSYIIGGSKDEEKETKESTT